MGYRKSQESFLLCACNRFGQLLCQMLYKWVSAPLFGTQLYWPRDVNYLFNDYYDYHPFESTVMTAGQNALVLDTAQYKYISCPVLSWKVHSAEFAQQLIFMSHSNNYFSPGSYLWWPNTNEWKIWYNWYMLEIISGWLCDGWIRRGAERWSW